MVSYLELLKKLPKTNCKECGLESCLLFALKVSAGELGLSLCPYLGAEETTKEAEKKITFNQLLENLKELRSRFKNLNILGLAERLGVEVTDGLLYLPYLDDDIEITLEVEGVPRSLTSKGGYQLDPRDEILIMNYFLFEGKAPLTQNFVGLESFPHSISKVKTLRRYAEQPLMKIFEEKVPKALEALKRFRISQLQVSSSGVSFVVCALPRVPLLINFWSGDPEDNLSSYCKVLYDSSALSYLDLEGLVFLAERFAEKLTELST